MLNSNSKCSKIPSDDNDGTRLPLHICCNNIVIEIPIIKLVLGAYSGGLTCSDGDGSLPLHLLLQNINVPIIHSVGLKRKLNYDKNNNNNNSSGGSDSDNNNNDNYKLTPTRIEMIEFAMTENYKDW